MRASILIAAHNEGNRLSKTIGACVARYDAEGTKCLNAYLHTKVNGSTVFQGDIKSGTRSSRHTNTQDPEPEVYEEGDGDKKIRLLGHWGSKVYYKDIEIRSVGSE